MCSSECFDDVEMFKGFELLLHVNAILIFEFLAEIRNALCVVRGQVSLSLTLIATITVA